MEAFKGRTQTTKGIWMAKSVGIEPCTVAIDLEGSDGGERGEDDTAFEKQSALFALAISDIVLVNMWCHDIGRVHAAGLPLLKIVFQVMKRLFSPHKTTLLFVIRDHTEFDTPLKVLEPQLRESIQQIWDAVVQPQTHTEATLSDFFNIEVRALPRLQNEEQSKEPVAQLRQRIIHSIAPGDLAGHRQGVPGSGFSFSAQKIWKDIREDKYLDLPAHKVMIATVKCEEIANEKLNHLTSDEVWSELEEVVKIPVLGFGRKLDSLLNKYLLLYDKDAVYFDEGVRTAKRQQLKSKALNLIHPAFQAMLEHLHSKALDKFKYDLELSLKSKTAFALSVRNCTQACMLEFDKGFSDVVIKHADWDASNFKEKLHRDIKACAVSELGALVLAYKKQLTEAFTEHMGSLFKAAGSDTWASIRQLYNLKTDNAVSWFSADLSALELDAHTYHEMVADLVKHARSEVERKAREEASRVLIHMKDRFSTIFSRDKGIPRKWTGKEKIPVIAKEARTAGAMVLSVMAALRLDNTQDEIQFLLKSNLVDGPPRKRRNMSTEGSSDPLASSTWAKVPPTNTLITPATCQLIWAEFVKETDEVITQAQETQKAHKQRKIERTMRWIKLAAIVSAVSMGISPPTGF